MANIVCPCLQNADFLHEVMRFSRDENIRFLFILILDFYLLRASRDEGANGGTQLSVNY